MIKVYLLEVEKIDNTEVIKGIEFISQAVIEGSHVRRVIIEENPNLEALAVGVEEPTQNEIDRWNALPEPTTPRNLFEEVDELKIKVKELGRVK